MATVYDRNVGEFAGVCVEVTYEDGLCPLHAIKLRCMHSGRDVHNEPLRRLIHLVLNVPEIKLHHVDHWSTGDGFETDDDD